MCILSVNKKDLFESDIEIYMWYGYRDPINTVC